MCLSSIFARYMELWGKLGSFFAPVSPNGSAFQTPAVPKGWRDGCPSRLPTSNRRDRGKVAEGSERDRSARPRVTRLRRAPSTAKPSTGLK